MIINYSYYFINFVRDTTHGPARQFELVGREVANPSFEPKFVCVKVHMTYWRPASGFKRMDNWVVYVVVDLYEGKILPYDFEIDFDTRILDARLTPHRLHTYTYCKLDKIVEVVKQHI